MRKHYYDLQETGCEAYPQYFLTHQGTVDKKYAIMVLAWDIAQNKEKGWFKQAEFDTIRECRAYMANFGKEEHDEQKLEH